jgi:hypothetical protein
MTKPLHIRGPEFTAEDWNRRTPLEQRYVERKARTLNQLLEVGRRQPEPPKRFASLRAWLWDNFGGR